MKTLFYTFIILFLIVFINTSLTGQGECILVIQGTREDDSEAFFNNSTDHFVSAMGATMPAPKITVIRPEGEKSKLGDKPARTEESYTDEQSLKKKIAAALCNDECKNVVIAFIGHGMGGPGGTGIENPPPDKNKGGMKIGPGTSGEDYIEAPEIAKLIDSCKKSVKLIASQCFAESMINGICAALQNKGLVGVAIGSSAWDKTSSGTGPSDEEMTYEFLMNFLKNYYLIIGNPNAMADIAKAAADLKKKNEEYNKKIEQENKEREKKIQDCEKMVEQLRKERDAISNKINILKAKIAKQKPPKATDAQQKELAQLNKDYAAKNAEFVKKEFELDALKNTPPKVPIPDHLPVMELIIHEAFKSAKALTKTSTGVEPVVPSSTGPVDIPKTPPTKVTIDDMQFVYYKVIDKKTGKCIVVGYKADANGNPIAPLKSIDCMIDCSKLKFSYNDDGKDKIVEATRNPDSTYNFTVDGNKPEKVKPEFLVAQLILPGQLMEEAYCKIFFNSIPEIVVPHAQVIQSYYDAQQSLLQFVLLKNNATYPVQMQFLPHEEILITIGQSPSYLSSATERFTLLDESYFSYGKMAVIVQGTQVRGSVKLCHDDRPLAVQGQLINDNLRFVLTAYNTSQSFQVQPMRRNPSLMKFTHNGKQGLIHPDFQNEPSIAQAQLSLSQQGHNFLNWHYDNHFLTDVENTMHDATLIIAYEQDNFYRAYSIPLSQNTWEDPFPFPQQTMKYKLYPVVMNGIFNAGWHGILYDEFGLPYCLENPGNSNYQSNSSSPSLKTFDQEIIFAVPNPFDASTQLHFSLESEQQVELRVLSANGIQIMYENINLPAGWNAITILADNLGKPGLYFYSIKSMNKMHKGKLYLIKH